MKRFGSVCRRALLITALWCTLPEVAGAQGTAKSPSAHASESSGDAANFRLPDLRGRAVSLSDFKDQILVLNFWAFWCDTWRAEMPHLKDLAARQREMGFRIVAISVDGTRLREFWRDTQGNVPFPVLLDVGGKVSQDYKIAHVPTVIILDAGRHIRYVAAGYPGSNTLLTQMRKILSEPRRKY